jgi:thiol-disulfide isomerase/thioredoxin
MRIRLLTLLFFTAFMANASARANQHAATAWHDSTRDVYINNELDRGAQVMAADNPSRLALISSKLERAIVLDVSEHTVGAVSKDAFRIAADHTTATSDEGVAMTTIGKFTRIDGPIYFFAVDGKPILIRAHPGVTGEMTTEKLWESAPVWRAVMENYQPEPGAVAAIRASAAEAKVTLLYGTWCPDSKNYIPRLIKALRAAGNDKIQVKLIGIDNQFREPADAIQPRRITNVPTVIVERDGREIGRIVETPAAKTMEEDLAAILSGKPPAHNGRWDRGPKIASGVYSYRDAAGKERGTESWELFSTAEGGYLVRSRVSAGDVTTEVFHRVDAERRPTFVEVTKQRGDERTRTRYNLDRNTLTARMRGSVSGVISQTVEVPDSFSLSSPSMAAEGLRWARSRGGDQKPLTVYLAPPEFDRALGTLAAMSYESKGEETVRVPAGEFRALRVTRRADKETSELWIHPQLGIPVRGKSGQAEYVLTSLELSPGK